MPESLDQNHVLSPSTELPTRKAEEEAESTVTFLPPLVGRMLIAGWILLFAGRWLVVQGMFAAGLLAPELVDNLDDRILGPGYLLLLSVTLVTLVVRIVRGRSSQPEPPGSKMEYSAPRETVSAEEGSGEAGSSDRGGKQA